MAKEESPLAIVKKEHFLGKSFPPWVNEKAGKILKEEGDLATIKFIGEHTDEPTWNFRPPIKGAIVRVSRPLLDWPVSQCSINVQRYVYSLTVDQIKSTLAKPGTSKADHEVWFTKSGVDNCGFTNVQGLNLILGNAYATYNGVLDKQKNRNEKLAKQGRELESATTDDGHLKYQPSPNSCIFCYQGCKLRLVNPVSLLADGAPKVERLDIPIKHPGHIPYWQRPLVRKHKRRYASDGSSKPLLARITIGEDYADIDLRGLMRNAKWRGLLGPDATTDDLLGLVSHDPILDPRRKIATMLYREASEKAPDAPIHVHKRHLYEGARRAHKCLEEAHSISMSIDLGQNELIACQVWSPEGENLRKLVLPREFTSTNRLPLSKTRDSSGLNPRFFGEVPAYREAHVTNQLAIYRLAVESLTPEQQAEVRARDLDTSEQARTTLCERYQISPDAVDWSAMTRNGFQPTTLFAEYLKAQGRPESEYLREYCKRKNNGDKTEPEKVLKMARDARFAYESKVKLPENTAKALREAQYELQRGDTNYHRLSVWRKELVRRIVNWSLRESKAETIILEDLSTGGFFQKGSGVCSPGWEGFFEKRRDNRWLINALHSAYCDLATHKGMRICLVPAYRTSITCPNPECKHVDNHNRNGIHFRCTKCGEEGHADVDVAAVNIYRVAVSGCAMPRESLSDQDILVLSRKPKTVNRPKKTKVVKSPVPRVQLSNTESLADPLLSQQDVV